jgi:hypothetical protein
VLLRIAFLRSGAVLCKCNLNNINHTMNNQIMSGDRYIAVSFGGGAFNVGGVWRILSKDGTVHPSRWNAANKRLESCSLKAPGVAVPMYHASRRLEEQLEEQLVRAGISYRLLSLEDVAA